MNELFQWFLKEINPQPDHVIIWIDEGNMKSIMQVPCDEMGYPKRNYIATMSVQMKHISGVCLSEKDIPKNITVLKKEIHLDSPLIVVHNITPKILVWRGRLWGEDMESLENLDINVLQKIVTEAIDKQDCIVLENVSDLITSIKNLNNAF